MKSRYIELSKTPDLEFRVLWQLAKSTKMRCADADPRDSKGSGIVEGDGFESLLRNSGLAVRCCFRHEDASRSFSVVVNRSKQVKTKSRKWSKFLSNVPPRCLSGENVGKGL